MRICHHAWNCVTAPTTGGIFSRNALKERNTMQWNSFSQLSNLKSQCWIIRSHIIFPYLRHVLDRWGFTESGFQQVRSSSYSLHCQYKEISVNRLSYTFKENRHFLIWWVTNYFWTQISGNIFMASHSPKWILPFSSTKPNRMKCSV